MKILVTVKRVEDPEIKIKIKSDGSGIESDQMKYVVNPFDEIAVEEALRVRDAQGGEVVVVCVGVKDAAHQIRTALAMGADRAVHVLHDGPADPWVTAAAVKKVIEEEKPDLVILGKQAVDDDMGQMGILLAERLGWGQATFASKEVSLESEDEKNKVPALVVKDGRVQVVREVDGGIETLSVALPAIVTTELRLNVPRYASLPGIMKAKKKEIKERPLAELTGGASVRVKVLKMEPPEQRKAGIIVPDVATLVQKLRSEAKVL
ncbi:MAG TPA: electron transfer flavoprotein subunit beta/FixA family protein [Myxococcota bacterium]|nr:electron transfer flavoprotein subunit beta/FixA family protein [Myxococcota bacterium]